MHASILVRNSTISFERRVILNQKQNALRHEKVHMKTNRRISSEEATVQPCQPCQRDLPISSILVRIAIRLMHWVHASQVIIVILVLQIQKKPPPH